MIDFFKYIVKILYFIVVSLGIYFLLPRLTNWSNHSNDEDLDLSEKIILILMVLFIIFIIIGIILFVVLVYKGLTIDF